MIRKQKNGFKHEEPLRILLASPLPPPVGGIATWTKILLSEIAKKPEFEIKHVNTRLRWKKHGLCSWWLRLSGGTFQALWDILRIGWLLLYFRPHALHLTTSAAYASLKDVVLLLLARLFGVSGLIHYHTSYLASQNVRGWQFRSAYLAMNLAARIVVLDPKTYMLLEKYFPKEKLFKIPNMIDLNWIDKLLKEDQPKNMQTRFSESVHCLFVGHVVPQKGIAELVEACTTLIGVQLHLVGPVEDPFRNQLLDLAKHRDEGRWLYLHGQVNNYEACHHILRSDIVLLPSYYEAFPIVILESMALSKPVVASSVGAVPEMINAQGESPCGLCVVPRDLVGIQKTLQWMLGHREQWEKMGRNGRSRVESLYSTQATVGKLEALWNGLRNFPGEPNQVRLPAKDLSH